MMLSYPTPVLVVVAASVVAINSHQAPTAAVSAAPSNLVVASDGTMPGNVHDHAVALLTKWNTQLGQDPKLTTPFDVIADPMGTPASESATTSGNSLAVTFTGVDQGKNQDCGYAYSAAVLEAATPSPSIIADPGTWPRGYDVPALTSASRSPFKFRFRDRYLAEPSFMSSTVATCQCPDGI